jgi:RNA recognition motif-containing protein
MNMYVSNLSFHTTADDLTKLFSSYGTVTSAKIITDRDTGRSRGFGFVEMEVEKDAEEAIKNLNLKEIEGRAMNVTIARDKPARNNNRRW